MLKDPGTSKSFSVPGSDGSESLGAVSLGPKSGREEDTKLSWNPPSAGVPPFSIVLA